MANSYDIPSWAGKPPTGLHLDVLKEDKLVQKLMVDEKKCYLFGRNNQMNDFCIDHASCSRVHAAFVYHKHLHKAFLVDLGSTHGTFIGTLRLEPHKPTQLQINSTFHFGASTRNYILRERPTVGTMNIIEDLPTTETMLGLPESQTELDNLTEYNTAHNRRISMLGIAEDSSRKNPLKQSNRKKRCVTFNDEEIIINPEDVDPNVGRFRNLIQTTVLPPKRARFEVQSSAVTTSVPSISHQMFQHRINEMKQPTISNANNSLYQGLPSAHDSPNMVLKHSSTDFDVTPIAMGTKLGLLLPNPAPEVTLINEPTPVTTPTKPVTNTHRFDNHSIVMDATSNGPQKKKYAKEAWPGRKPMLGQL